MGGSLGLDHPGLYPGHGLRMRRRCDGGGGRRDGIVWTNTCETTSSKWDGQELLVSTCCKGEARQWWLPNWGCDLMLRTPIQHVGATLCVSISYVLSLAGRFRSRGVVVRWAFGFARRSNPNFVQASWRCIAGLSLPSLLACGPLARLITQLCVLGYRGLQPRPWPRPRRLGKTGHKP